MENLLLETRNELSALTIATRSVIMYFIALLLIRFGGLRIIGKKSGLDLVIVIMLGAILARGVMGQISFTLSVLAGATMIFLNRFLVWISVKYPVINYFLKGKSIILYSDDQIVWENMSKSSISFSDFITSLRLETNSESLDNIKTAYMEPNGRISFVFK